MGIYRSIIGVFKGDTRSLDYSSHDYVEISGAAAGHLGNSLVASLWGGRTMDYLNPF